MVDAAALLWPPRASAASVAISDARMAAISGAVRAAAVRIRCLVVPMVVPRNGVAWRRDHGARGAPAENTTLMSSICCTGSLATPIVRWMAAGESVLPVAASASPPRVAEWKRATIDDPASAAARATAASLGIARILADGFMVVVLSGVSGDGGLCAAPGRRRGVRP